MPRQLKVGILGFAQRGQVLGSTLKSFPAVEIVACCETSHGLQEKFTRAFPGSTVYSDYGKFLEHDFDILVIVSFCPNHGTQAVQALNSGKHVLSEVTAFHTMAEGVRLVEAVKKTGKKYMMAENACYLSYILEMRKLFKKGLLGKFMYGECEYVHDLRDTPNPTGSKHWRSWLPPIYYCTHSIGPLMTITGDRPVAVTGMCTDRIMKTRAVRSDTEIALVKMASGAVIKILVMVICARKPPLAWYSLYGTRGTMETTRWEPRGRICLYQEAGNKFSSFYPKPSALSRKAAKYGHGGSDYLVIKDFIDAIRKDKALPIDVYMSADMTLPGILAYRSVIEGGKTLQIPDLRRKAIRDQYRNDDFSPAPAEKSGSL